MKTTPKLNNDFLQILDNVIVRAYKSKNPVANGDKKIVMGDLLIVKKNGTYNVVTRTSDIIVYSDLFLIDAAFLIAKNHQLKNGAIVKQVLALENKYAKYYLDMKSYTNSYQHAKSIKDFDLAEIMQTRYQQAKYRAKELKDDIRHLREKITQKR